MCQSRYCRGFNTHEKQITTIAINLARVLAIARMGLLAHSNAEDKFLATAQHIYPTFIFSVVTFYQLCAGAGHRTQGLAGTRQCGGEVSGTVGGNRGVRRHPCRAHAGALPRRLGRRHLARLRGVRLPVLKMRPLRLAMGWSLGAGMARRCWSSLERLLAPGKRRRTKKHNTC